MIQNILPKTTKANWKIKKQKSIEILYAEIFYLFNFPTIFLLTTQKDTVPSCTPLRTPMTKVARVLIRVNNESDNREGSIQYPSLEVFN